MNLFRYGAAGDVLKRGWGDDVVRVVFVVWEMSGLPGVWVTCLVMGCSR